MHSKLLPPSGAHRWTVCTAAPEACKDEPDVSSVYADEGTTGHSWAAQVLQGRTELLDVPDDFRAHVGSYVATCEALKQPGDMIFVEAPIPLWYLPEDPGTVDFAVVSERGIHVRDLKYGAGVLVNSVDNKQLAIYAYSLIKLLETADASGKPPVWPFDFPWPFEFPYTFALDLPVTIQAIQPRHHEWIDQPWILTVGELRTFCEVEIEPAAELILGGHPTQFAPGEHVCRWCAVKFGCPARAEALNEGLPESVNPLHTFENLDAPDPIMLNHEQILSCFRNADTVRAFLKDVESHVTDTLLRGEPFEGCKLVTGREGNRDWANEEQASQLLVKLGLVKFDQRYTQKIRSPSDAENQLKLIGVAKPVFGDAVTRSPGRPVAALEEDKRPAIAGPVGVFTNLDEEP